MKTFRIKDEDGTEYKVEELEKETVPTNDEALTDEEIAALKRLAGKADSLLALLDVKDEVEPEVKEEVNEVLEDDGEEIEKEKEEIVDTDEEDDEDKDKICDSVNSISLKTKANDSFDIQDSINEAWQKRFNGGNK